MSAEGEGLPAAIRLCEGAAAASVKVPGGRRIARELGQGGMGAVYLGRSGKLGP